MSGWEFLGILLALVPIGMAFGCLLGFLMHLGCDCGRGWWG